jgi:predicted DNA binding CopG/RHH family protein
MKKQSKKSTRRKVKDAQLEEFETRDLGTDIRTSGVTPVVIRPKSQPTSILLDEDLVRQLRMKAAKRGVGYQTMLKIIVREHLDEY